MNPLLISSALLATLSLLCFMTAMRLRALDRAATQRLGGVGAVGLRHLSERILTGLNWNADSEVQVMLDKLGWRKPEQRNRYLFCHLLAPFAAIAFLWLIMVSRGSEMSSLLAIIAAGVGFLLPKRFLAMAVAERQRRLVVDVSTFLPLLRMFFETGMTVEQSLRVLSDEGRRIAPDLSQELRLVLARVDAGLDLGTELRAMAKVLEVDELSESVVILEQMIRQGGGALASLRNLKTLMDEKRVTDLQEKVTKMAAKISGVMVLFFLPALFIVVGGPGFIAILQALGG